MGSRVKNPEALAIGLAVVRFAEYSLTIDNPDIALDGTNSIGYITSVAVTKQANNVPVFSSAEGKVFESDSYVLSEAVMVDCSFTELTISNIDAALGGGSNISKVSEISGETSLSSPDTQVYYRVEVEIVLKDNTDMVTFVLPKCKVTSQFGISTSMEDLANSPMKFSTVNAYEGAWGLTPIGKIIHHN